jgi:hypothetical protein
MYRKIAHWKCVDITYGKSSDESSRRPKTLALGAAPFKCSFSCVYTVYSLYKSLKTKKTLSFIYILVLGVCWCVLYSSI